VEGDHGLYRLPPGGGAAQAVGASSQLDDIVSDGKLLYATVVTSGEVLAIDAGTGDFRVLVTGIGSAQGLALLPDGRLAVADSGARVIGAVGRC
jgi:sugar lactone lactonase YvrE